MENENSNAAASRGLSDNEYRESVGRAVAQILGMAREQIIIQLGYLVTHFSGGELRVPGHLSTQVGTIRADLMQDLMQDRVLFLDRNGDKIPHKDMLTEHILFLIKEYPTSM